MTTLITAAKETRVNLNLLHFECCTPGEGSAGRTETPHPRVGICKILDLTQDFAGGKPLFPCFET